MTIDKSWEEEFDDKWIRVIYQAIAHANNLMMEGRLEAAEVYIIKAEEEVESLKRAIIHTYEGYPEHQEHAMKELFMAHDALNRIRSMGPEMQEIRNDLKHLDNLFDKIYDLITRTKMRDYDKQFKKVLDTELLKELNIDFKHMGLIVTAIRRSIKYGLASYHAVAEKLKMLGRFLEITEEVANRELNKEKDPHKIAVLKLYIAFARNDEKEVEKLERDFARLEKGEWRVIQEEKALRGEMAKGPTCPDCGRTLRPEWKGCPYCADVDEKYIRTPTPGIGGHPGT